MASEYLVPTDLKSLQHFLGLAGWYHKFIQGFTILAVPLNCLKKKGFRWEWSSEGQACYKALQAALQNPPVLALPNLSLPFQALSNASELGLGAILTQQSEEGKKVLIR